MQTELSKLRARAVAMLSHPELREEQHLLLNDVYAFIRVNGEHFNDGVEDRFVHILLNAVKGDVDVLALNEFLHGITPPPPAHLK